MSRTSKLSALLVLVILIGGFLSFTGPGHNLLRQMGVMTACSSSDCNNG